MFVFHLFILDKNWGIPYFQSPKKFKENRIKHKKIKGSGSNNLNRTKNIYRRKPYQNQGRR